MTTVSRHTIPCMSSYLYPQYLHHYCYIQSTLLPKVITGPRILAAKAATTFKFRSSQAVIKCMELSCENEISRTRTVLDSSGYLDLLYILFIDVLTDFGLTFGLTSHWHDHSQITLSICGLLNFTRVDILNFSIYQT